MVCLLGLDLWLPTWYHANWMVGYYSFWVQELWQDLWASGQTETVTIYHVTGHLLSAFPGNDESGTLAQVH